MRWLAILLLPLLLAADPVATTEPSSRPDVRLEAAEACMNFTAPPDTLLQEFDPDRAQALLATNPDYAPVQRVVGNAEAPVLNAIFRPRCAREMEQYEWEAQLKRTPKSPLMEFRIQAFNCPTIFLHERTSPAGHKRLVHVEIMNNNALSLPRDLIAMVIDPPTATTPARSLTPPPVYESSGRYVPARISFGQVDPNNPAHFSFDFSAHQIEKTADGQLRLSEKPLKSGTIDGYLNDDDTVTFKYRDPATTRGL